MSYFDNVHSFGISSHFVVICPNPPFVSILLYFKNVFTVGMKSGTMIPVSRGIAFLLIKTSKSNIEETAPKNQ